MRLDNDLDPGRRTVPSTFLIGLSVSCSIAPVAFARVKVRDERLGRRLVLPHFAGAKDLLSVA